MGYFHASMILSLSLLRIVPDNVNLLLVVAFTNYQTFGRFRNYLLAAAIFDPARTINFLERFWVYERFRPMDRLQDYHLTKAELAQLAFDVDEEIDERSREIDREGRAR